MTAVPASLPEELPAPVRGRFRGLPPLRLVPSRRRRFVGLTATLRGYLDDHPEVVEAIVRTLIERAIKGDMRAMAMVWDRVDGPVR